MSGAEFDLPAAFAGDGFFSAGADGASANAMQGTDRIRKFTRSCLLRKKQGMRCSLEMECRFSLVNFSYCNLFSVCTNFGKELVAVVFFRETICVNSKLFNVP